MTRVTANIAARDHYTDFVLGLYTVVENAPTYEDCLALYGMMVAERGEDDARALLSRFGCRKIADLKDMVGLFADFYRFGSTSLLRGVSPTYTWSILNSKSNHLRDRWLLYHDGSEVWWEVRGKLSPDDLASLASGEVMDVSGVPKHEEEFKRQSKHSTEVLDEEL
jgi:hypothetical protein